jgi:hypothetical protein
MDKDARQHELCQTRENYRNMWETRMANVAAFCGDWSEISPGVWRCGECGRRAAAKTREMLPVRKICRVSQPVFEEHEFGPGHELMALLKEFKLPPLTGCGCKAKARKMDHWGVAGCWERFDEIVDWLREAADKQGRMAKIRAAFSCPVSLAFHINPLDPIPSLVREAIRRAEAKLNHV